MRNLFSQATAAYNEGSSEDLTKATIDAIRTLLVGSHVAVLRGKLTLKEPGAELGAKLSIAKRLAKGVERPRSESLRKGYKMRNTYASLLIQRLYNENEG